MRRPPRDRVSPTVRRRGQSSSSSSSSPPPPLPLDELLLDPPPPPLDELELLGALELDDVPGALELDGAPLEPEGDGAVLELDGVPTPSGPLGPLLSQATESPPAAAAPIISFRKSRRCSRSAGGGLVPVFRPSRAI